MSAVAPEDAIEAAQFALAHWFRIDRVRPEEGYVTTFPQEYIEQGGTGRLRDGAINYPNHLRRTATVRVRPRGESVTVECVVLKERRDTSDHRVFSHARQFDDLPNQTPIEVDAATSSRQNEVWTSVGRDRALERQILQLIRERLQGPA